MILVPLADIEVRSRQRTEIETRPLNELKESILGRGLLHPPVCFREDGKWILVAGERRTSAIRLIARDNLQFWCSNVHVPAGQIPILPLGEYLDAVGRFEAELDENIFRVDLTWQDRSEAYAKLHKMRQTQNPAHTIRETAEEIVEKSPKLTSTERTERIIRESLVISQHLNNPKIASARNHHEALSLIYKSEEEEILAALAKRQFTKPVSQQNLLEVRHGDLLTILPSMDSGTTDLICTDPPYGVGADKGGFRARTVHHHNYEDTLDVAKSVAESILTEGFRICKPRANIFIFCDIELFDYLKLFSANMGWSPFKRPLIWRKSESEGLAPWGSAGPRITTEFIFYATKGRRGLNASPIDVFDVKRVSRHERLHAAEKPVELLSKLISCATLPGELVLDPCCGSGSSLVACKELGRQCIGIERDKDFYNTALANIQRRQDASAAL